MFWLAEPGKVYVLHPPSIDTAITKSVNGRAVAPNVTESKRQEGFHLISQLNVWNIFLKYASKHTIVSLGGDTRRRIDQEMQGCGKDFNWQYQADGESIAGVQAPQAIEKFGCIGSVVVKFCIALSIGLRPQGIDRDLFRDFISRCAQHNIKIEVTAHDDPEQKEKRGPTKVEERTAPASLKAILRDAGLVRRTAHYDQAKRHANESMQRARTAAQKWELFKEIMELVQRVLIEKELLATELRWTAARWARAVVEATSIEQLKELIEQLEGRISPSSKQPSWDLFERDFLLRALFSGRATLTTLALYLKSVAQVVKGSEAFLDVSSLDSCMETGELEAVMRQLQDFLRSEFCRQETFPDARTFDENIREAVRLFQGEVEHLNTIHRNVAIAKISGYAIAGVGTVVSFFTGPIGAGIAAAGAATAAGAEVTKGILQSQSHGRCERAFDTLQRFSKLQSVCSFVVTNAVSFSACFTGSIPIGLAMPLLRLAGIGQFVANGGKAGAVSALEVGGVLARGLLGGLAIAFSIWGIVSSSLEVSKPSELAEVYLQTISHLQEVSPAVREVAFSS